MGIMMLLLGSILSLLVAVVIAVVIGVVLICGGVVAGTVGGAVTGVIVEASLPSGRRSDDPRDRHRPPSSPGYWILGLTLLGPIVGGGLGAVAWYLMT
jgi:hypothetical protein